MERLKTIPLNATNIKWDIWGYEYPPNKYVYFTTKHTKSSKKLCG